MSTLYRGNVSRQIDDAVTGYFPRNWVCPFCFFECFEGGGFVQGEKDVLLLVEYVRLNRRRLKIIT